MGRSNDMAEVTGDEFLSTSTSSRISSVMEELNINSSLEDLQTDEQRRVLDIVAQVRKCGLESVLSLPQLVVCGDQSSGKSSVLEALTEIPFPRNDNLCTRFATEISLRRAATNALTIKVIPDSSRPPTEQATIKVFEQSITDFSELPRIMAMAMEVMGISNNAESDDKPSAFARDVLSIEIDGPTRPQLTLVDIPGLIATKTKGVTKADVDLVAEITDHYISQPRTICLAVVSAVHDYANQKILEKVRDVDPDGERTLGIITKPDGLAAGSGSEKAFLDLARNQDIFFKLGWHVLKNRKYEERNYTLMERNMSEATFFRTSNFNSLPKESVGIDSLRTRLSILLFEHIKNELPKLREDLRTALVEANRQLETLGTCRSSASECKAYLTQLSLDYYEIVKAAVEGHYEGDYFLNNVDPNFSMTSSSTVCRTRAVVQTLNTAFSENLRRNGHKYHFDMSNYSGSNSERPKGHGAPEILAREKALDWVRQVLVRTRGKELVGNFNPLLVGELFWEQSSKWRDLATVHAEEVAQICHRFLKTLLQDKCPKDVEARVWAFQIEGELRARDKEALEELELLLDDLRSYPINYNHYYTDTISKRRQDRQTAALAKCAENSTVTDGESNTHVDIQKFVTSFTQPADSDMENFSCEEALDCLFAIYKVSQKTFIANVTTQVIERHIVRGLERIFSPVMVNRLSDPDAEAIASEPSAAKRQREHLVDQISKLEAGHDIFRSIL